MEASEDSSIQKSYTTISGINTLSTNDHNSKRHQPISLEVVWATQEWSHRPFVFLLAMMEVNVKLVSEHFGGHEDKGMIAFHKQFAQELINNDYLKREAAEPCSSAHWCKEMDQVLISLPCGKKLWHRNGGFQVILSTGIMY